MIRRPTDPDDSNADSNGDRAISTTLDVTLALVLVAAAVVTLAGIAPPESGPPPGDQADETAEVIGATTATVHYSLAPGARRAKDSLVDFEQYSTSGPEFRRTAHGTLASHLTEAAVGNVVLTGKPISHAGDGYEKAVRDATRTALATTDADFHIRALWRPYPDAPVHGSIAAGERPPPDVPVYAATITTDSGLPAARERAISAAESDGFDGVARVVANATIRGLFPPQELRVALRGDHPVATLAMYRYVHAAAILGIDYETVLGEDHYTDTVGANDRLSRAIEDRIRKDLERSYDEPEQAARDVSVGHVTITVRTWSP